MGNKIRLGLQINEFDSDYAGILIAGISSYCKEKEIDLIVFSGRSFNLPFGYEYQSASIFGHINSNNIEKDFLVKFLYETL